MATYTGLQLFRGHRVERLSCGALLTK